MNEYEGLLSNYYNFDKLFFISLSTILTWSIEQNPGEGNSHLAGQENPHPL
jgi:hypothetical protein